MYNTNENKIKKVLKKHFGWTVLTVSCNNHFYKVAIKKNLFKKTYKLCTSKQGVITEANDIVVDLSSLACGKIFIPTLGSVKLENVSRSVFNPSNEIQEEQRVFERIENNTKLECTDKFLREQRILIDDYENKLLSQQDYYEKREYNNKRQKINCLSSAFEKLLTVNVNSDSTVHRYENATSYQRQRGITCNPVTRYEQDSYSVSKNLEFIITQMDKYAKSIGFMDFNIGKLQELVSKIEKIKEEVKMDYKEEKVQFAYSLHGTLIQELVDNTLKLCQYISANNIDYSTFTYYDYYAWSYWDDQFSVKESSSNMFDKSIDGISKYIEKVCGEEYKNEFLNQVSLNFKKEKVLSLKK